VRKLFGSGKKRKRIRDYAVKDADFVDSIETEDYLIEDILLDEYFADEFHVDVAIDDNSEDEYYADHVADYEVPVKRIKGKRIRRPLGKRHIVYASMILVGVFFSAAALRIILSDVIEDAAARTEYGQLRESFPQISAQTTQRPEALAVESDIEENIIEDDEEHIAKWEISLDELAAINPDFVGWINANSDRIDYPVVRGADNDRYISTTFSGSRNSAGAIFMDFRNTSDFDENVVILYGHRTRDGSMFTSLLNHLDPEFRQSNPNISILTRDGRRLTYVIFEVRLTDAWDPIYTTVAPEASRTPGIFPNAPADATHFLILSSCTASSDDDERILVYAALVQEIQNN